LFQTLFTTSPSPEQYLPFLLLWSTPMITLLLRITLFAMDEFLEVKR
jgi:hypothetical protein